MDARFPTRYLTDRRVLRLSAEQFRAWTMATAWSVTNRTDGVVEKDDLPLIPPFTTTATEAAGLVEAGLWKATSRGWLIVEYASTQTSGAEMDRIEKKRQADREYRAKKRAEEREAESKESGDSRNDVVPTVEPTTDEDIGPDNDSRIDVDTDVGVDVDMDVGNDGQGKSKSKSKGSLRGSSQTELESFEMPTDEEAIGYRETCDDNNLQSVGDVMKFDPSLSRKQAENILVRAFPGRRAG